MAATVLAARVAVSQAVFLIDKPYLYLIPAQLEQTLCAGMRVIVPFGKGNKKCEGIVLQCAQVEPNGRLKYITAQLDETPVLSEELLRLALWMRERYFCTVYDAARAMLPSGLYFRFRERFVLAAGADGLDIQRYAAHSAQRRVLEMVAATPHGAERGDIYAAFGTRSPYHALQELEQAGLIQAQTDWSRKTKEKSDVMVHLLVTPEQAMEAVTPKRKSAPLRFAVVEMLVKLGSYTAKELCYFTGASMQTLRSLERSGLVRLEKYEVFRRVTIQNIPPAKPITLNAQQQAAYEGLLALSQSGAPQAALLYGVTGSGKTQVYLQLIESMLAAGRNAMILVPEIVLTPQLLQFFTAYLGDDIAVLHSALRETERFDEWRRIKTGQARVVIGTRSAVFAPLENIGLLILDEEQETSYKSTEQTPRYHAREVAKFRVNQHGALLLLGSATPAVESFYQAQQGSYHLFSLANRFNQKQLPRVIMADMREELKKGNDGSLGQLMLGELEENIARGEQSILFINRRGASRMVSCAACGEVPACPNCSVKLTYHSANKRLMCHYCGHSMPMQRQCPSCGGAAIFIGAGTQKVEAELKEHFPDTAMLRMDADTINAKQSHEAILSRFEREEVPILIGTQMVAKGLDFPNVTLVGVVDADLSLYVDDFRAGERSFSLLTQVVGRAGRGEKKGRAVIQTLTPENDVIACAAVQDYDRFYASEIVLREAKHAPPFADMLVLTASGPDEIAVHRACMKLRQTVEQWTHQEQMELSVLGPAPAAVMKINNRYRYRLTLVGKNDKKLRRLVAGLLRVAAQDRENKQIHIFADCNPMN